MTNKRKKNLDLSVYKEYIEELKTITEKIKGSISYEGPSWNIETSSIYALSNIHITPGEIIVTADMPNIDPKTINVEIFNENTIEITAKLKKKVKFIDLGIHHRRGEFSFLRCRDYLQVAVDAKEMKVSCKKGVLEVRFPRKKMNK